MKPSKIFAQKLKCNQIAVLLGQLQVLNQCFYHTTVAQKPVLFSCDVTVLSCRGSAIDSTLQWLSQLLLLFQKTSKHRKLRFPCQCVVVTYNIINSPKKPDLVLQKSPNPDQKAAGVQLRTCLAAFGCSVYLLNVVIIPQSSDLAEWCRGQRPRGMQGLPQKRACICASVGLHFLSVRLCYQLFRPWAHSLVGLMH